MIRDVRSAVARSRRYWQISRIAVRHRLGPYLRGRRRGEDAAGGRAALALSLWRALEEGGVAEQRCVLAKVRRTDCERHLG